MTIENGHKLANQMRRAIKLAAAIDRGLLAKNIDPYDQAAAVLLAMRDWSERDWQVVADAALITLPSKETQAIVAQIYRDRAKTGVSPFPRLAS